MNDTQQMQADLDWVVNSPPLIDLPQFNADIPDLDVSSVNPQQLAEAVSCQKSRFLGPYFETLWRFVIEHSQSHRLIAHGLQVIKERRTLGEFDFLVQHRTSQQIIHQEIAVKYYLGVGLTAGAAESHHQQDQVDSAWFGPNSIDRLDLKLHKLIEQQIHLADRPESIEVLKNLSIATLPAKQILMKGYLFQPLDGDLATPAFSHPNATLGRWLPVESINRLQDFSDHWAILPKLQWLSRARRKTDETLNFQTLLKHVAQTDGRPILIAAMTPAAGNKMRETQRYFVVSNQWKSNALESLNINPLTPYCGHHDSSGTLLPPCRPPV